MIDKLLENLDQTLNDTCKTISDVAKQHGAGAEEIEYVLFALAKKLVKAFNDHADNKGSDE